MLGMHARFSRYCIEDIDVDVAWPSPVPVGCQLLTQYSARLALRSLIPPQRIFEMFYKMLIFVGVLAVGKVDAVPSAVLATRDAEASEIKIASLEAKVEMLEAELAKQKEGSSVVAQKKRNVTAMDDVGCARERGCASRCCEP